MRAWYSDQQRGVLLVEVLIALALFLAISTIIAQALSAGFVSEKASRTRSLATATLEELLTQVRASSESHWDNIAGLARGVPYTVSSGGGAVIIATGSTAIIIDGTAYSRSFVVRDGYRDIGATTTALMLTATSSAQKDSGSLLIDGTVTWGSGERLELHSVLTRWRNIVCGQTSWSVAGSSTENCETPNIPLSGLRNIQTGDKLMLCSGC